MKVTVNGKEKIFDDKMTLNELIDKLRLDVTGMIVERNLEVVSRSEYGKTTITDGDKIELIRLVGGG